MNAHAASPTQGRKAPRVRVEQTASHVSPDFLKVLDRYRRYLTYEERRTQATIDCKGVFLRGMAARCGGTLFGLDRYELEESLAERNLSDSCKADYVGHLRRFYTWAMELDEPLCTKNPAARMVKPKKPIGKPNPLTALEWEQVLHAASYPNVKQPLRLFLMLERFAGMRCYSVSKMEAQDIDWDADTITVRAKGKKTYEVYMPPVLKAELRSLVFHTEGPLFYSPTTRQQRTPVSISQTINRHMKGCGITKTAHKLRHTYGTQVYQDTRGDIVLTQQALGHTHITSTQVYAQGSSAKLRAVVMDMK